MTITDEQLSRFLDADLPPEEQEAMRRRLETDEELARRLEAIAAVDAAVLGSAAKIDDRPMPAGVVTLLKSEDAASEAAEDNAPTDNVVAFPFWRRAGCALQDHAMLAASIALVVGFGAGRLLGDDPAPAVPGMDGGVPAILAQTASGDTVRLTGGTSMTPNLSFQNEEGDWCRQYTVRTESGSGTENIACREDGGWAVAATVHVPAVEAGGYRTASGGRLLDGVLDRMMAGAPLDADGEAAMIDRDWTSAE